MKTALRCAICLCVLLLLSACGAARQQTVRTELIEVPTIAYAPLPGALTEPLVAPPPPPRNCLLRHAMPAVCALDALMWAEKWYEVLARANEDRATSAKLTREASETGRLTERDTRSRP